ncbi:MAG: PQQ-binding-like beta-propeller repeat protein [Planctomycetota bacterium]|nr:PQQ-binding-like beta-propeller repeat protein [Planctomycetota bacterium]
MSLLAVIPGLAPGLLALLPQLLLLLFALFVVLLSPRTWWRALGYTVRRPKWALLLVLTAGAGWYAPQGLAFIWPAPVAGEPLAGRAGEFSNGDSTSHPRNPRRQGPTRGVKVDSYRLPVPVGEGDLLADERIFRFSSKTGNLSCERFVDGESPWELKLPKALLFPPLLVRREAEGSERPGYLLALSASGSRTELRIVDANGGALLAVAQLEGRATREPTVIDEMVVIACRGSLQAFSLLELPLAGSPPAWKVPSPVGAEVALAGDENGHCFALGDSLAAVNIETGEVVASADAEIFASSGEKLELRIHQGLAFVSDGSSTTGGKISCLQLIGSSFEKRWEIGAPGLVPGGFVLCAGKLAYLSARVKGGGELRVLDAATGRGLSRMSYSSQAPRAVTADLSSCYVVLSDGRLSRFSHIRGREEWRVSLGAVGAISGTDSRPPVLWEGKILVARGRELIQLSEEEEGIAIPGWTGIRGGPGRGGNPDPRLAPLRGGLLWRRSTADASGKEPGPVVPLGDSIAFVEREPGGSRLRCLDRDGKRAGELQLGAFAGEMVSRGERIFLLSGAPGEAGVLIAVDKSSEGLAVAWRRPVRGALEADICLDDGGCVIAGSRALVMVDIEDGEPAWEREDLGGAAALCSSGRELAVARGRTLLLVDPESGNTLGALPQRESEIRSIAYADRRLYLESQGVLEAFSRDTGELLWSRPCVPGPGPGLVAGPDSLVVSGPGELLSVDPDNGADRRSFPSQTGWRAPPALALGMAVAVDGITVIAFDPRLGDEVWRLDLEGRDIAAPTALVSIIGSRVYIRSADELVCIGEGGAQ